jgi:NADH:ubiquinone oxidoreductase subunit 2 (subunit N)
VIVAIFFKEPPGEMLSLTSELRVLLAVLIAVSLGLGIFPNAFLSL